MVLWLVVSLTDKTGTIWKPSSSSEWRNTWQVFNSLDFFQFWTEVQNVVCERNLILWLSGDWKIHVPLFTAAHSVYVSGIYKVKKISADS